MGARRAVWVIASAGALVASAALAQSLSPAPPQIEGEITASSPANADGKRYSDVQFNFAAGQQVEITASVRGSGSLNPMLEVRTPDGALLASDDDSGGGPNARVYFIARTGGDYVVRVLSFGPEGGSFALTVEPAMPSVGAGAALQRFYICPGHPRCPRQ